MAIPRTIHQSIGWIGVGKMGNPMATRLIEAGHTLVVCDPVAENRASLVARGAKVASSPEDLAAKCKMIFTTIPNDAILTDLIWGADDAGILTRVAPGTTFVEMSTVSPQLSERVACELTLKGVFYLRCPVSGSTALARNGTLTAMASGDAAAWDAASDLLDLLTAQKFYLGPGEEARFMKLVLNTMVGATAAILAEALLLGEKGGLNPAQMMDVIAESVVGSPLIKYKKDMIARMDFAPAFSVLQMMKDFRLITDAGRDRQIPLSTANLILQQYISAAEAGYAEQDFFSLFDWMRNGGRLADD